MGPSVPESRAAVAAAAVHRGRTPSNLRDLLSESGRFVTAAELITSRGLITEQSGKHVLRLARELAENPRIDALSITDNPGGNAMLAPDTVGTDLIHRGQEVIIHLSCKDWNRNALQSRAWKLSSEGFHNVLALSGDYPIAGHKGVAAPVFDTDSVGLLRMLEDMNEGTGGGQRGGEPPERTRFFLGAVVTNHKRHEREVMPQYFKLRKKIENGARFVINQVGYDTRKDDELLRWMKMHGLSVPVMANVFVLRPGVARVFNAGRIPGVVVTDELLALVERHAASQDKGRGFFLDAPLRGAGRALYGAVERGPRPIGKTLHLVEQASKVSMFGCRDCGDCSLPDIAYLCPESQCAKNQRNGPCGGTRDGACEVGEKECIWALGYERLKKYGEEETMLEGPAVIKDNSLRGTSAWANAFLGRDHQAKQHEAPSSAEGPR